jgi:hypothetical protein
MTRRVGRNSKRKTRPRVPATRSTGQPRDDGRTVIGLAPALIVEEALRFGPFVLEPIPTTADASIRALAARFAREREASPDQQAVISIDAVPRELVPTLWSLFVFACVSYARRQGMAHRGVPSPESFYVVPATHTAHGVVFDTGQTVGLGGAEHVPLRWPVDWPARLHAGAWDRRLELACAVVRAAPDRYTTDVALRAIGMAASLAYAALERRTEKVMNVETPARTTILLGSAFEALHRRGTEEWHSHAEVVSRVSRLDPANTLLGHRVFAEVKPRDFPAICPGDAFTRPMFVAAQLTYLRNQFAHGTIPPASLYSLPPELGNANLVHAATGVLAALIGDDISRLLDCVVPPQTAKELELVQRLGLRYDVVHAALEDSRSLLLELEATLVPKALRDDRDEDRRQPRSPTEPRPPVAERGDL